MSQTTPTKIANTYVVTKFGSTDTVPPTNLAPSPTDGKVLTANSSTTAGMEWDDASSSSAADIEVQAQQTAYLQRNVPQRYNYVSIFLSRGVF